MATNLKITSISNLHGETARAVQFVIATSLIKSLIKSITPKTITIR
jgi:hypothetical protein